MKNFYNILEKITLGEIAKLTDAKIDEKYSNFEITNLGSLESANEKSIIYLALGNAVSKALDKSSEYKEKLKQISAGACFITNENIELLPSSIIPVIVADPKLAFIKLTHKFFEDKSVIKFTGNGKSIEAVGTGISKLTYIYKNASNEEKVISCNVEVNTTAPVPGSNADVYYTVTIHNADLVSKTQCKRGLKPELPVLERDGYIFSGWYLDEGFTNEFKDFDTPVEKSFTLYAGWDTITTEINIYSKNMYDGTDEYVSIGTSPSHRIELLEQILLDVMVCITLSTTPSGK